MPLVKAVSVRINVTGGADAAVQIDRVRAKAAELAAANPTIKVKVDTAAARLQMDIFRAGLRADLAKAAADAGGGGRGGILGWLGGGGGFAGVKAGAAGGTGFFGTIGGALSGLVSAGPAGIAVLAGLAAAAGVLIQALGGAIAAIAAAGFGIQAFGALALPTFSKITAGVTAVGAATTKVKLDKAWDAIPKSLQPAVQSLLNFQAAYGKLAAKLQPDVLKIFNDGLKVANQLLPVLLPFAKSAATAIDGLVKGFGQFAQSAGFKSFLAQMQTLAGPAITVIGRGIGGIVIAIGKLLQQMASPTGLLTLQLLLRGIAGAINMIGFSFRVLTVFLPTMIQGILGFASIALGAVRFLAQGVLAAFGVIIRSAASAFGWIPGIGPQLKDAARNFDVFRVGVLNSLNSAQATLARWSAAVRNAPKIFKLQADITELQNKLATARGLLANPDLTRTRRARIEANIDDLQRKIALAQAALASLQNKTIYINTVALGISGTTAHATTHRASGGWASGLTMVGEMGRELVALPQGSYVYPHAQTERMVAASAGGGNTYITINATVGAGTNPVEVGRQIAEKIKPFIKAGGRLYPTGVSPR